VVLAAATLSACGAETELLAAGDGGSSSSSSGGMRVPAQHRQSDAQCSTPAPPGNCSNSTGFAGRCSDDSTCTAGANGRCISPGGGVPIPCTCTYDECMHDTDCAGEACACHGSAFTGGYGNRCVSGNCRTDADCGAGGYCSPSEVADSCGDSLLGFFCRTPGDLCVDDSDCPAATGGTPGTPVCVYTPGGARWECGRLVICP
jgi:hypothetical protein